MHAARGSPGDRAGADVSELTSCGVFRPRRALSVCSFGMLGAHDVEVEAFEWDLPRVGARAHPDCQSIAPGQMLTLARWQYRFAREAFPESLRARAGEPDRP